MPSSAPSGRGEPGASGASHVRPPALPPLPPAPPPKTASDASIRRSTAPRSASDSDVSQVATQRGAPPPSARHPKAVADAFIGRYRIIGELGRGGMGVVYEAEDPHLRRPVAIKLIQRAALALDADDLERFRREAQLGARLRHPGIVAVHELGEHEGCPYLVMDRVRGENLDDLLRRRGPLRPRRAAEMIREVALALEHAHRQGVIHRDVKPHNLILDGEGHVRLTDFGLARDEMTLHKLTVSGEVLGTPSYMAPEQASGRGPTGPWTDVWGLGACLYRALLGRAPFESEDGGALAVMQMVLTDEPVPPRRLDPTIHPDIETIVLRCLEKHRAARYPSAEEVARELERFLGGETIVARRLGRVERFGRWARRHPARLAAFVLGGLLALALGALPLVARSQLRAAARADAAARLAELREAKEKGRDAGDQLGAAIASLQAAERLRALDDSAPNRQAVFDASLELAAIASDAGQWSLALRVLHDAAQVRRGEEVEAARQEVVARKNARTDHVRELLARAAAGELAGDIEYRQALFDIVGGADETSTRLIAERLDRITDRLAEVARGIYGATADPTPDEMRANPRPIPGLLDAIEARLRPAELRGPAGAAIDEARARLVARARGALDPQAARRRVPDADGIVASAQRDALGPGELRAAELCAEALGWSRRSDPRAVAALGRYLAVEHDPLRAVPAGIALCMIGDETAREELRAVADRFAADGAFWERVGRFHERAWGSPPPLAAPGGRSEALRLVDRGREMWFQDRPDEALAFMDEAVALDPQRAEARIARGWLLRKLGRLQEAAGELERAIELDPDAADAYLERAIVHQSANRLADARADLDRAIALAPDRAIHRVWRARIQRATGDARGALADLDEAVRLDPADADALTWRALVRSDLGDTARALADLDRAIELRPDYPEAWNARGHVRSLSGDASGAIADFGRVIELAPDNPGGWSNRGRLRKEIGDLAGAIADHTRALELAPNNPLIHGNRADAHRAAGDHRAALADYRRAQELDPTDAHFPHQIGNLIALALGRPDQALPHYDRAAELAPSDPSIRMGRGSCRVAVGDLAGGLSELDEAVRLAPSAPTVYLARGESRARAGDVTGALADLETVVRLAPGSANARQAAEKIAALRRNGGR